MVAVRWQDLLSDIERDEILVLRELRMRAILEIGKSHIQVSRAESVVASAKTNLRVAEQAANELESRITTRLGQILSNKNIANDVTIDIDQL